MDVVISLGQLFQLGFSCLQVTDLLLQLQPSSWPEFLLSQNELLQINFDHRKSNNRDKKLRLRWLKMTDKEKAAVFRKLD